MYATEVYKHTNKMYTVSYMFLTGRFKNLVLILWSNWTMFFFLFGSLFPHINSDEATVLETETLSC